MPDSGFLRGLGDNARRKRNRRFVELLSRLPQRSISILDVGGTVEFWKTAITVEVQRVGIRHFPVGTYQRARDAEHAMQMASRIRNLSRSEVRMLFPGSRIENETVLGFTKSFLIHNIPE